MIVNKVNFTGFKNVSCCNTLVKDERTGEDLFLNYFLNSEVTDDFNGKDYTDFKNAAEKSGVDYTNKYNPKFLNLGLSVNIKKGNLNYTLNGKSLKVDDSTIPLFTFIAKLTKKIKLCPDKSSFIVDKGHFDSKEYLNAFNDNFDEDGNNEFVKNYDFIKNVFDYKNVKNEASYYNDILQQIMNVYFEV